MLLFWLAVFVVSLIALVKGADWLLKSSEKIGLSMGLSPFVVGVVIVGLGTSFPEMISSITAVLKGATEIVPANAIGSNIANILLIVGMSAVVGGQLAVTKSLIDLDLPLLAISTVFFLGVCWDRMVTMSESILLLVMFVIYILYTMFHRDESGEVTEEKVLPARHHRRKHVSHINKKIFSKKPKVTTKDYIVLVVGIGGLVVGAKYLIDSVIALSEILNIAPGVISLAAVALGTSLPELIVSIKAALDNKPEVALGNVFGSNVFNFLLVVGVAGMIKPLSLDEQTFMLGIPVMIVATFLFIVSGISKKVHIYEGAMYLMIYFFFIGKLFNFL